MSIDDYKIEPKPMVPLTIEGKSDWETAPEIGVISGGKIEPKSLTDREILQAAGWTFNPSYMARDTGTASTSAGMSPADYPFFGGSTYANRATAPFRVTTAGALVATSATITGSITATSGTIGGFSIGANVIYSGTGAARVAMDSGGTNPAFYAGAEDPATAPFSVTKAGLLTATNAVITGAITASSGSIGSFTIGTYLYTGSKTAWNDANAGVHIGSDGIGIGNNVFTVNGSTGALVATSATITGTVNATAGYFGNNTNGVNIDATGVTIAGTGHISTATSGARVEMLASGIKWYDATTQRGQILNDGSGWMGSSTALAWTTTGAVSMGAGATIGGFTIGAHTITATGVVMTDTGGIRVIPGSATDPGYFQIKHADDTDPLLTIWAKRDQVDAGLNDSVTMKKFSRNGAVTDTSIVFGSGGITVYNDVVAMGEISAASYGSNITPTTSDGGALGSATKMWSDLFLASGAVINFNAGDYTITHSADHLVFSADGAGDYICLFKNGTNAYGIDVQIGPNDGTGTNYYYGAHDGDGDLVGYIANTAGTFALTDVSDERLKRNIVDSKMDALSIIRALPVREFERIKAPGQIVTGFVAQEAQAVYPAMVSFGPDGYLGVMKDALIPVHHMAIQQLEARIAELEAQL